MNFCAPSRFAASTEMYKRSQLRPVAAVEPEVPANQANSLGRKNSHSRRVRGRVTPSPRASNTSQTPDDFQATTHFRTTANTPDKMLSPSQTVS